MLDAALVLAADSTASVTVTLHGGVVGTCGAKRLRRHGGRVERPRASAAWVSLAREDTTERQRRIRFSRFPSFPRFGSPTSS